MSVYEGSKFTRITKKYTDNLCNKLFVFNLKNGKQIKIALFRESMCHLMGLQHVYDNDRNYLGCKGYKKILENKITTKKLKKHNKIKYNFIKERLEHFDEIINVLRYGKLFWYAKEIVKGNTYIHADFLMYKDKEEYLLHLFLIKEKNTDIYTPNSFIAQSRNDVNAYKFIDGQKEEIILERQELII